MAKSLASIYFRLFLFHGWVVVSLPAMAGVGDLYLKEKGVTTGNFSKVRTGDAATGSASFSGFHEGSSSPPSSAVRDAGPTSGATPGPTSELLPQTPTSVEAKTPVQSEALPTVKTERPKGFSLYMTRLGNALGCFSVFLRQITQLRAQNVDTNVECSMHGDATCEKTKEILQSNDKSQHNFYECLDKPTAAGQSN